MAALQQKNALSAEKQKQKARAAAPFFLLLGLVCFYSRSIVIFHKKAKNACNLMRNAVK